MGMVLIVIAALLFWCAIIARLAKRELRENELLPIERDRRVARLWGIGENEAENAYREKVVEHCKTNLKFEFIFWSLLALGAALGAAGLAAWMSDEPGHTAQDVAKNFGFLSVGVIVLWWAYQLVRRLYKAENEIRWLIEMLVLVSHNAEDMRKGSIQDVLELRNRIDALERTPPRQQTDFA